MNRSIFGAGCLLLLTAALAFTGCARSDNTTAGLQVPPPPLPVEQGEPIIVYQRSGGLNGMEDRFCVYGSGSCDLARKNDRVYRCQVMSLKLRTLEQAFAAADFFALPVDYPGNAQADAIRYSITYTANGKNHRVVAYSDSMPDSLRPLVRQLDQCIMLISTTVPK